ncbi:MAG: response regulator transcription factor [Myxococcota bacterium]
MKLAVVDDQVLVLRGLAELLGNVADFEVVLQLTDGQALLDALREQSVDVVVMDVRMPGMGGPEAVRRMRDRGDERPVLMLTTFDDEALFSAATEAGAQGFMLKDSRPEDLEAAIRKLDAGGTHLEPVSSHRLRARRAAATPGELPSLSERELDVLRLMAGGYSNREIAKTLFLAEGTVKNYVSDVLGKLDTRDRTRAVLRAITLGLV